MQFSCNKIKSRNQKEYEDNSSCILCFAFKKPKIRFIDPDNSKHLRSLYEGQKFKNLRFFRGFSKIGKISKAGLECISIGLNDLSFFKHSLSRINIINFTKIL